MCLAPRLLGPFPHTGKRRVGNQRGGVWRVAIASIQREQPMSYLGRGAVIHILREWIACV